MENQQSSFMREQSEEERETFEIKPILETLNRDPREQRSWQPAIQREYQAGYEGPYAGPAHIQSLGEKIVPRRPQMYNSSWLRFVAGGILILALAGFMTGRYDGQQSNMSYQRGPAYHGQWDGPSRGGDRYGDGRWRGGPDGRDGYNRWHHRGHQQNRVFEVPDHPQITINNYNGRVHVHAGEDNRVVVSIITPPVRGGERWSIDSQVQSIVGDEGSSITVNVDDDINSQVDLDITVPEMTDLYVRAERGAVRVDGVRGDMHFHSIPGPGRIDAGNDEG